MFDKDVHDLLATVVLVATTDKDNLKVNRHLNKQSIDTAIYVCVCVDVCVLMHVCVMYVCML